MMLVFALVIIFTGSKLGSAVFNQVVVGPLVNAVILSAVLICDIKYGILVAALTPLMAVWTAQLPAPMAPFAPFIIAGNIVLAAGFGILNKYVKAYGTYIGIAVGAALKTLLLAFSARYLILVFKMPFPKPVMQKLAVMMSYPQLYSALAGGAVALLLYSIFKRTYGKTAINY
jgi:hypothetical protein